MKTRLILLIIMSKGLFSCGQAQNSACKENSTEIELPKSLEILEDQFSFREISKQNNVDTKYEYTNTNGNLVIIENSFPRGGQVYTHPDGERYIYAVFWTRITNKTSDSLELKMEFLEESYQLPSSPDRIFKLLIPSDTLTDDKESLINYGLDIDRYLNHHIHTQNKFKRTVKANDSSGFYIVTLFNKGVNGTLRTGVSLKDQNLFYRVNDEEIHCGQINYKN